MSDMDEIVNSLREGNGGSNNEFENVIKLIEAILSLVQNLIEDIAKINHLEIDCSKLEIKFEYLTQRLLEFEKRSECSVNKLDIVFLKKSLESIKTDINSLKDKIEHEKEEALKEKKDNFVNQGKGVVILAILLSVIMFIISKAVFPYIQNLFP